MEDVIISHNKIGLLLKSHKMKSYILMSVLATRLQKKQSKIPIVFSIYKVHIHAKIQDQTTTTNFDFPCETQPYEAPPPPRRRLE